MSARFVRMQCCMYLIISNDTGSTCELRASTFISVEASTFSLVTPEPDVHPDLSNGIARINAGERSPI